ncbi:MAG TPA: methyltransferase domain-containing protein [Gaiellaceae bacterium]|nr:methyltransferase domain-containing protein [Gaiellaceae bacterium]
MSAYDSIARLYDPWSRSVVEDVDFYVSLAVESGGPVVELGVGTGRIAIPTAIAGVKVIGVDASQGMLDVAREQAEVHGVSELVDLRLGDLRTPPVKGRFPLVTSPFRAMLHMETERDRKTALRAARKLVAAEGTFVFDVFEPSSEDIEETNGKWLEREPGIWERADWVEAQRTLILRLRSAGAETEMSLAWLPVDEWRALIEAAGFAVEGHYGWFDKQPYAGGEDSIWVCKPV